MYLTNLTSQSAVQCNAAQTVGIGKGFNFVQCCVLILIVVISALIIVAVLNNHCAHCAHCLLYNNIQLSQNFHSQKAKLWHPTQFWVFKTQRALIEEKYPWKVFYCRRTRIYYVTKSTFGHFQAHFIFFCRFSFDPTKRVPVIHFWLGRLFTDPALVLHYTIIL